jgi:uncharacterized membrane protein YfcA
MALGIWLYVAPPSIAVPLILICSIIGGAWLGARTYCELSNRNFHDIVLGLLSLSGAGLVWSGLGLR